MTEKWPKRLPSTLTTSEMVELLGVTSQRLGQLASAGIIERVSRGVYATSSVPRYLEYLRKGDGEDAQDARKERLRLLTAQADAQEIKNTRDRGETVNLADVEAAWSSDYSAVRARMLAAPSRVQQTRPHLTAEDVAAFDAEIRLGLEEVADAK